MHPNFVLNVNIVQTEGIQGYISKQDVRSVATVFSCPVREYKVVRNEQYHSRAKESAYIFVGILDACVKGVMSSLLES